RLLDDHVLAALGGGDRVLGVQVVRRRDVDEIDVRAVAHRLETREDLGAVFVMEFIERVAARVGRGGDLHIGQLRNGRQDLRARDPEPRHAHPERGHRRALASSSAFFVCCLMSVEPGIRSEMTCMCGKRFARGSRTTCGGSRPSWISLIAFSMSFRAAMIGLSEVITCSFVRSWTGPWLDVANRSCA